MSNKVIVLCWRHYFLQPQFMIGRRFGDSRASYIVECVDETSGGDIFVSGLVYYHRKESVFADFCFNLSKRKELHNLELMLKGGIGEFDLSYGNSAL